MCDDEATAMAGSHAVGSTWSSPSPSSTPLPLRNGSTHHESLTHEAPPTPAAKVRRTKSKSRRLKLYGVEEKIDIIDYARVIGNRAAGREFNVAESSIREWRKNECRLRQQMATADSMGSTATCGMLRFEESNVEVVHELDRALVGYIGECGGQSAQFPEPSKRPTVDWFMIRQRAEELWRELERNSDSASLPSSVDGSVITMGWVSRFMQRNADVLPRIAPPPSAPTAAVDSPIGGGANGRTRPTPTDKNGAVPPTMHNERHRRKCLMPRRVPNPTLSTAVAPARAVDGEEPATKKKRRKSALGRGGPPGGDHQAASGPAGLAPSSPSCSAKAPGPALTGIAGRVPQAAVPLEDFKAFKAPTDDEQAIRSAAALLGAQLHQLGQALLNFNATSHQFGNAPQTRTPPVGQPNPAPPNALVGQPSAHLAANTGALGGVMSPADAIAMWLMKNC